MKNRVFALTISQATQVFPINEHCSLHHGFVFSLIWENTTFPSKTVPHCRTVFTWNCFTALTVGYQWTAVGEVQVHSELTATLKLHFKSHMSNFTCVNIYVFVLFSFKVLKLLIIFRGSWKLFVCGWKCLKVSERTWSLSSWVYLSAYWK